MSRISNVDALLILAATLKVPRANKEPKWRQLMGNDGSGWSMSVWPRSIDREGQDKRSKLTSKPRAKDDGKPDRLSSAGTIRHAAPNQKSELIKAGDARQKKRRMRKPKSSQSN